MAKDPSNYLFYRRWGGDLAANLSGNAARITGTDSAAWADFVMSSHPNPAPLTFAPSNTQGTFDPAKCNKCEDGTDPNTLPRTAKDIWEGILTAGGVADYLCKKHGHGKLLSCSGGEQANNDPYGDRATKGAGKIGEAIGSVIDTQNPLFGGLSNPNFGRNFLVGLLAIVIIGIAAYAILRG